MTIGIHHLLKKQLPQYVQEKYPTFCTFLDYYYRWLSSHGFSKLEDMTDIDHICDSVLIKTPNGATIDESTLISYIGYELKDLSNGAKATILGVSDDGKLLIRYITQDAKFASGDSGELNIFKEGSNTEVLIEGTYRVPTVFIDNFAKMLDANSIVDITNENAIRLLKHIKEYYTMKGTEESVNFLMYALKGIDTHIMYPWENVLKPSDGRWIQNYSIALKTTKEQIERLSGDEKVLRIYNYGVQEYKAFNIKSIEFFKNKKYFVSSDSDEYEQYIRIHLYEKPSTIYFGYGSECRIPTADGKYFVGTVDYDVTGFTIDSGRILSVDILSSGKNYSQNTKIEVLDSKGRNANLGATIVNGRVLGVNIKNSGENYSENPELLFVDSTGTGASASARVTSAGYNWVVGEVFKVGGSDDWKISDNSYDIKALTSSGNTRWFKRGEGDVTDETDYNKVVDVYQKEVAELPLLGRVTAIGANGSIESIELLQLGEYIGKIDEDKTYEISPLLFENRSSWDESYNAFIKFKFDIVTNELGYWEDERGFLSYPDIVLQDSSYFQQFSYDIFTESDKNDQFELLKDIHPAGTKQFNTQMVINDWDLGSSFSFEVSFPYTLIENGYTEFVVVDDPHKVMRKHPFYDTFIAEEVDFVKTFIKVRNDMVSLLERELFKSFTKVLNDKTDIKQSIIKDMTKRLFEIVNPIDFVAKRFDKKIADSVSSTYFVKKLVEKGLVNDNAYLKEKLLSKEFTKVLEDEFNAFDDEKSTLLKVIGDSETTTDDYLFTFEKKLQDIVSYVEDLKNVLNKGDLRDSARLVEYLTKNETTKVIGDESIPTDEYLVQFGKILNDSSTSSDVGILSSKKGLSDIISGNDSIAISLSRTYMSIFKYSEIVSLSVEKSANDATDLSKADYGDTEDGVFFVTPDASHIDMGVYTNDESSLERLVYTLDENGVERELYIKEPIDYVARNTIYTVEYITAPSGRVYYRHESGMGSVMVWNDNGVERETLILDMKYQTATGKITSSQLSRIAGITLYNDDPFIIDGTTTTYILGSASTEWSDYENQTDAILDAKFNWRDEHTSKYNTDCMYVYGHGDSAYAGVSARNITVYQEGCDIPNMQTLVRIFCDIPTIQSLDPTITSKSTRTWKNLAGWSSSCSTGCGWEISSKGMISRYPSQYSNSVLVIKDLK